jgi:hypothetical protein
MIKIVNTAVLPDGRVVTRKSERVYPFLVAANTDERGWGAWSWSTRRELANKALLDAKRRVPTGEFHILDTKQS